MQEKIKKTQKLGRRNTYTPTGTALACSNCDLSLKVLMGRNGVAGLKTFPNNSKEHQHSGKSVQDLRVPVLNMHGKPLMPTKPQKARKLLEADKARVVSRTPFVIQLLYATGETKQEITLGVDSGYRTIGYSAVSSTRELIAGELELRTDIKRLLEKRKTYRRTRRNRLWYRKPRFNNRSRREGWLAPSLEHKLQSHIKLVDRLIHILPITKVIVEVASFDAQKMKNPEISGIEYQQGELQGYNVRNYLLEKFNHKCAYCGKENVPLEIEHIVPKSRGGSNSVSNLTLSCRECNLKKGNKTAEEFGYPMIQKKAKQSLKATAFMNVICRRLVDILNCYKTYGHITKHNRVKQGLEKSHINDAFIIAGGDVGEQERSPVIHKGKQVRRQNRSLYKANLLKNGKKKRNTVKEVKGFRRFDKVLYGKVQCFIFGLRSSEYFDLRTIDGEKIGASVSSKKLKFVERARGRIEEVKKVIPPTTKVAGLLTLS